VECSIWREFFCPGWKLIYISYSTRVNYAQNLPLIHGLETLVCMATSGAMSIEGGNWQIFDRMLNATTKNVHLSTAVTALSKQDDGTYILKYKSIAASSDAGSDVVEETTSSATFDTVILAAPYQFASLDITPEHSHVPDEIPYVNLHVTLFTSPHVLAPAGFNLGPDEKVPQVVLTTLLPDEDPGTTPVYPGKAGFYSISTMRSILNPRTGLDEYIYKIFSPAPVTSEFLARILGVSASSDPEADLKESDVSWIYRKLWQSYPYEYPRVTFEELRLDENLWYTSGIESFISTMETSALMGMNVAKLVVDEWVSQKKDPYFQTEWAGRATAGVENQAKVDL
jgi:prenylcysteine oxidase/farnesylcysteine lyase